MEAVQEFKSGDPRYVIASAESAPDRPPSELLWRSIDPVESLRMSRIIVNGGWLALTLNEKGARDFFSCSKDVSVGTRMAYHIARFGIGTITKEPMLHGQFLSKLEDCADNSLHLLFSSSCIYFRTNKKQDQRVLSYDLLTEAEIADTRCRILARARYHTDSSRIINKLLGHLMNY